MKPFLARCLSASVAALAAGATLCAPRAAHAWGDIGHKVIARIAWNNLSPASRTKIITLLKSAPADADLASLRPAVTGGVGDDDADLALFESAATWPDIVRANRTDPEKARNTKYHHGTWHYKDIYFEQDPATGRVTEHPEKKADPENSIERLGVLSAQLADPLTDAGQKAVDIAWIEHLVGDSHMPLHNTGRITAEEPDGDQGGNKFIAGAPELGRDRGTNLHYYWDNLPNAAYPALPGESPEARLARIADAATAALPRRIFVEGGFLQAGRFDEWNREGADISETQVYNGLTRGQTPGPLYYGMAKRTTLVALAKAGYRLAATLDAAVANQP